MATIISHNLMYMFDAAIFADIRFLSFAILASPLRMLWSQAYQHLCVILIASVSTGAEVSGKGRGVKERERRVREVRGERSWSEV